MNTSTSAFDFGSSTASSAATSTTSSQPDANDHLSRLAAMTQGVGKEDPETSSTPSTEASLYPVSAAYMQSYGWPQNYNYFGQPLGPATFPGWPQCYPNTAWPNYGELFASSKKGRQTYQRYQTSVLEAKFQQSSYVSKKQREELRLQTQLTDRQIKIWFQNRRMKAKKEKQRVDDHTEHTPLLPANPPKGMGMDMDDEKKWQMAHWPPAAAHNPYQYPLCPP
ncbi:Homeobox protein egl-5 [Caenorhabditis elegans]|uniref:Isoform c of Homeobox protein egl-5 n=1 Tax=Caenorhabditis elegans TaxID=6239 RepID=P17486-3|nr:Homeobox protein egl-5 [Caenorhabditis elegans]CCD63640.1 Homeobox protein egl-5 [Caenorhabditis elegans]|eukprot:NP_001021167.1 Homeobox protein egl-5 [Caenorhabditis elegans]